jgi:hypothetical protein
VQGTFLIAMDQLNWMQPEFVINMGEIIEGYAGKKTELDGMWEEVEEITAKLKMPLFYTRGNHDVSFPGGKEEWLKGFGQATTMPMIVMSVTKRTRTYL